MYDNDIPVLRAHGHASPKGFADVATFVLLTIRQRLELIEAQFKDVRRRGAKSVYLFGSKRDGFHYLQEHAAPLHADVLKAYATQDTVAAIDLIQTVPGLGIVKGAFVAQCLGFTDAACLDSINVQRMGFDPRAPFLAGRGERPCKPAAFRKRIEQYLYVCNEHGNARYWWNSWCDYKANDPWGWFKTGNDVSRAHVTACGLSRAN